MFGQKQTYNMMFISVLVGLLTANVTSADNIVGNGGFEVADTGGPEDSAMWNESTSTFSELEGDSHARSVRKLGSIRPGGLYVHHLETATRNANSWASASITQNTTTDAGQPSLQPGDYVYASFDAIVDNDYWGWIRISLDIVNGIGGVVASRQQQFTTYLGDPGYFDTRFGLGNIQVPEFGPAPADWYSASLTISVFSFVGPSDPFGESVGEAFIDNVEIYTGPVPYPEPSSLVLFGGAGLLLFRRCRAN